MPSPLAPRAPSQAISLANSSPRADASPMDLIRALASPRVPACDPAGSTSAALGSAAPEPGPGSGPGLAPAGMPARASAVPTGGADSEGHPADQGACGGTAGRGGGVVEAPVPEAAGAAPGEGKHLSSMSPGAASASDSAAGTEVAGGKGAAAAGAGEARAQSGAGQAETGPSARAERRVRLVSPVRPPQAPAEAKALSPGPHAAGEPAPSKPAESGDGQGSGLPQSARASSDASMPPSSPAGAVLGDAAGLSGGEGPRETAVRSRERSHTLQLLM